MKSTKSRSETKKPIFTVMSISACRTPEPTIQGIVCGGGARKLRDFGNLCDPHARRKAIGISTTPCVNETKYGNGIATRSAFLKNMKLLARVKCDTAMKEKYSHEYFAMG
jgi:hypothetical protein